MPKTEVKAHCLSVVVLTTDNACIHIFSESNYVLTQHSPSQAAPPLYLYHLGFSAQKWRHKFSTIWNCRLITTSRMACASNKAAINPCISPRRPPLTHLTMLPIKSRKEAEIICTQSTCIAAQRELSQQWKPVLTTVEIEVQGKDNRNNRVHHNKEMTQPLVEGHFLTSLSTN